MIQISDELKELYRTDCLPFRTAPIKKTMYLHFPELNLTLTEENMESENFTLTESICSECWEILFGQCESTEVTFSLLDAPTDLVGKTVTIYQTVEEKYNMPLGTYIIASAEKRMGDLRWQDITAYDKMQELNKDCANWYNSYFSSHSSVSMKQFRSDFFKQFGFTIIEQNLVNDSMQVTKTITASRLTGLDVAKAIGEINGAFGHISRNNVFHYVTPYSDAIYPSETLYPAEDLFPSEVDELIGGENTPYFSSGSIYQDYIVKPIDTLQLRQEDGDIGVTVGTGNNGYIVQGNFLLYGKSAQELKTIATNLLGAIQKLTYRPCNIKLIGLPYLEPGDSFNLITDTEVIESFVLKRTLTGIQAFEDEFSAEGEETRNNEVSLSTEIEILNGKTLVIEKSVDGLSVTLTDTKNSLESKIEQTAESIMTNVTDSLNGVESNIQQLANEISLKVSQGEMESAIQIAIDGIQIIASQIALEGATTINGGFKIDLNGDMECVKATLTNCNFRNGINYVVPETGIPYTVLEFLGNNKFGWGIDATMSLFRGRVIFDEIPRCGDDLLLTSADLGKTVANYTHKHTTNLTVEAGYAPSEVVDGNLITFKNASGGNETGATPGYVKAYISSQSDERLKDMIGTIDEPLKEKYMKLVPMVYRFKDGVKKNDTRICFGFSAQEVAKIFCTEEYSLTDIDYEPLTGEKPYCPDGVYHLNDRHFHGLHTYMIQSQQKELSDLKAELSELKQQLQKKGVI